MGDVYRAIDLSLGREVALKVLPGFVQADPDRRARLEREARLLASLNHPSIATLHGYETAGDQTFLVMELVPGETLADEVARGPLSADEVVSIASEAPPRTGEHVEPGVAPPR
jgi:serine/threonine-protein kinase